MTTEDALATPSTGCRSDGRVLSLASAGRHGQCRAGISASLEGESHPQPSSPPHRPHPHVGEGRVEDVPSVRGAPHEAAVQGAHPPGGSSDVLTQGDPPRDPSSQGSCGCVKYLPLADHAVGVGARDPGDVTIELEAGHSVTDPSPVQLSSHHSLGAAVPPAGPRLGGRDGRSEYERGEHSYR